MHPEDVSLDDKAQTEAQTETIEAAGTAHKPTAGRRSTSRKRSITIFIVVSLLNVGLLALLWSQLLTPAQNSPNANSNQGSVDGRNDPLVGKPAPSFTLAMLNGQPGSKLSLTDFKGKPVVLNIWASWCDPCKRETPLLQSEWQQAQSHGIAFIGMDFQDKQSDGLSFLQQHGVTYPNVVDSDGSTAISYGVTGVPETVFIDRHGTIVSKVRGELTAQTLQSNLQLLES
jgi:cytochrome c biogenesis protein CcmG/thiol:disulfide interchange protein DsbE